MSGMWTDLTKNAGTFTVLFGLIGFAIAVIGESLGGATCFPPSTAATSNSELTNELMSMFGCWFISIVATVFSGFIGLLIDSARGSSGYQ